MNHLRKHLSVANVLSCIALFAALSGAAYAATLGKNAVKTKNIANGAVTASKLKNGAVTGAKLANGAVTSSKLAGGSVRSSALGGGVVTSAKLKNDAVSESKILNGAVTNAKLGPESVTTGKLGPESVTATRLATSLYSQLVKNVTYVNAETATSNEGAKTVTATCPVGKQAIGGGARVSGELEEIAVTGSNPFAAPDGQRTGWSAFGRELPDEPGAKKWAIEAFAVCAEL